MSSLSAGDGASSASDSSNPDTDPEMNQDCGGAPKTTSTPGSAAANTTSREFLDALEDVHTRFILNLPLDDLESPAKIFFQVEQAWWFYEDWICDAAAAPENLPRFSHLKPFAQKLFEYSPLLPSVGSQFMAMWNEFAQYKRKISNYGCILLNSDCSKVVLCQVWNGKSWSFPSGKINQGETGVEAATRETYEETGFDPHCALGLTRTWRMLAAEKNNNSNSNNERGSGSNTPTAVVVPWNYPLQEFDALSYQEPDGKRRTCYVCSGVPEDFPFEPVCRKEVSRVEWFALDSIPKPNYAVGPFLPQLKRWINKKNKKTYSGTSSTVGNSGGKNPKKKKKPKEKANAGATTTATSTSRKKSRDRGSRSSGEYQTPRRGGGTPGRRTPGSSRPGSRQGSRPRSNNNILYETDALVEAGLANAGDLSGWSEQDMFTRNEELLGRKIEYDGNPHQFAEQGFFGGLDPHAFHVVGGAFLNGGAYNENTTTDEDDDEDCANKHHSGNKKNHHHHGISSLAPPPQHSKLQPLFNNHPRNRGGSSGDSDESYDDGELQPFFSDDGVTPWGQMVREASGSATTPARTIPAAVTASAVVSTTPSNTAAGAQQQHQRRHRKQQPSSKQGGKPPLVLDDNNGGDYVDDDDDNNANNALTLLFTDAEITRLSQATKLSKHQQEQQHEPTDVVVETSTFEKEQQQHQVRLEQQQEQQKQKMQQYYADLEFIRVWVANLPKPKPTRHFGEFKLDAQLIMERAMMGV